jgi:hypothetical protein
MEKKQTALVWLLDNLLTEPFSETDFQYNLNCWDKAKEMEKEQIINAHGIKEKKSSGISNYIYKYTGEEYYNETFKTE